MNQFTERHYQALLRYLKEGVRSGTLQDGSKLPLTIWNGSVRSNPMPGTS